MTGSIDARGVVPRQRPHRVVAVLLESLAVQDGHTAAPVVGEYAAVVLGFSEPSGDVGEVGVATYRVRADPVPGWRPLVEGKRWDDTTYPVAPTWRTVLHGDGWTATWLAPRPVIGNLELRGTLTGDWTYGVSRLTRGRVLRVRMVGGRIERTEPHSTGWVPGAAAVLREVEVGTGFADGMTIDPAAPPGPGVKARVLADPPVREHGVLLDFDLDDTPSPPLRAPFWADAVAAHRTDLWLVDRSLPTMLRLRGGVVVDWVSWPGMVLTGEGPRRALHADADGCWITAPAGTVRADLTGRVHTVDETPVRHAAATADGTLALACDDSQDHAATLRILRVGGDPRYPSRAASWSPSLRMPTGSSSPSPAGTRSTPTSPSTVTSLWVRGSTLRCTPAPDSSPAASVWPGTPTAAGRSTGSARTSRASLSGKHPPAPTRA